MNFRRFGMRGIVANRFEDYRRKSCKIVPLTVYVTMGKIA